MLLSFLPVLGLTQQRHALFNFLNIIRNPRFNDESYRQRLKHCEKVVEPPHWRLPNIKLVLKRTTAGQFKPGETAAPNFLRVVLNDDRWNVARIRSDEV